jgi:hypothetical protein
VDRSKATEAIDQDRRQLVAMATTGIAAAGAGSLLRRLGTAEILFGRGSRRIEIAALIHVK